MYLFTFRVEDGADMVVFALFHIGGELNEIRTLTLNVNCKARQFWPICQFLNLVLYDQSNFYQFLGSILLIGQFCFSLVTIFVVKLPKRA